MTLKPAQNSQIWINERMEGRDGAPPKVHSICNPFISSFLHTRIENSAITACYGIFRFHTVFILAHTGEREPAHGLPGDKVGKGAVAYLIETTFNSTTNELLNRALGRRRSPLKRSS